MPRTPSEPPSEDGENGAESEREWMEIDGKAAGQSAAPSVRPPEVADHPVVEDHLSSDFTENPAAKPDDPSIAIHQPGQPACAQDHDRQREPDTEHDEDQVVPGGRRHSEDVVETHRDVGDDDDPDRLPQRRAALDLRFDSRL